MDRFSRESIIQDVLDMGFSHAGLADVGTLKPLEAVREMCAVDKCHAYGKNWSCPPGCGTIPECEAEMRSYDWGVLVQITQDLEDDLDFEGWKEAGKRLRDLSVSLHEELVKRYPQVLALGGAGSAEQPAEPAAAVSEPAEETPEELRFIVREHGGTVCVFREGFDVQPAIVTEISVGDLPAADRALLEAGMEISGREALLRLLEDLGS